MGTEGGSSKAELWRRIQVGERAWRKVEGLTADRKISRKLKGNVLDGDRGW